MTAHWANISPRHSLIYFNLSSFHSNAHCSLETQFLHHGDLLRKPSSPVCSGSDLDQSAQVIGLNLIHAFVS